MFKAALISLTSSNIMADNIAVVSGYIREAAAGGATFISTPETTHLMEMNRKAVLEKTFAEGDDPGLKAFRALAKELKVWLHIGSLIIKVAEDRLANRAFVIAPDGDIAARYDKIHLFDVTLANGEAYRESALYDAGDTAVTLSTPFGTLGLSVCYDLRFPYLYRALATAGANILLVPAAFTKQTGEAHWHTLLRARAIETGSFVLAAAQGGLHATGRETYGHSLVVSPWGEILADGGTGNVTGPGVTFANIDLDLVAKARQTIPSLTHTRAFTLESL
ncbi:carbon-nitrogen hydrolase family protein [Kordiimonas marina]|uniref:carbon-nitrogen hydrolase family protein n=1 Tax=Kordiimonas marina TaxID=2872312 RepID=UPI001FF26691|nr:carbon-nitrogen hydrolase family protein [Kordiimonas marina]